MGFYVFTYLKYNYMSISPSCIYYVLDFAVYYKTILLSFSFYCSELYLFVFLPNKFLFWISIKIYWCIYLRGMIRIGNWKLETNVHNSKIFGGHFKVCGSNEFSVSPSFNQH